MHDLLGKEFTVEDADYRVVDIRNIDGVTMIYAEQPGSRRPLRAAFRLADLATQLEKSQPAA
ncbi:MAG: hypothetical protein AAF529_19220 [Pseudomonadota bacterium]